MDGLSGVNRRGVQKLPNGNQKEGQKMNTKEVQEAWRFLNSMRGQYIVSQALYHAIKVMEQVPEPYTEVSNIKDMKYLMDNLFPIFKAVAGMEVENI